MTKVPCGYRQVPSLLLAALLLPVSLSAGTTAVSPIKPNNRDTLTVSYSETDWFDSCPPEVAETRVEGTNITVRLEVPGNGCILAHFHNPYAVSTDVPRLAAGTYDVTVEAPEFGTGQTVSDTVAIEVTRAVNCESRQRPGASLLLPYFEANLDNAESQRTLFAVGTVANRPILAHVVLWTNWGWPTVSFDTVLPPNGLKTFDVASLLSGDFPSVPPPSDVEGCTTPITNPTISPVEIRALFTGQPSPIDGLCYASAGENPAVATGYVTVDVVRGCSGDQVVTPGDAGYFEEDLQTSRATQENVLWGDFYLVDSSENLAEGETLVSLYADSDRYGVGPQGGPGTSLASFYGDTDHRMPLPHANRARFLDGGNFDADTEVLAWTEGSNPPTDCSDTPGPITHRSFVFSLYDEQGALISDEAITTEDVVRRFRIGESTAPPIRPFGIIDLGTTFFTLATAPPGPFDSQSWMLPIVRAEGRFGIASGSIPVEDFCRP